MPHIAPGQGQQTPIDLRQAHAGVVAGGGLVQRREGVGHGVHLEIVAQAAEHHVAGVADGEQDLRLGEQPRDQRQVEGPGGGLVEEDGLGLTGQVADGFPVALAGGLGLWLWQGGEARQPLGRGHVVGIGLREGRGLFQGGDVGVTGQQLFQKRRARAWKADQEDVGAHGRFAGGGR